MEKLAKILIALVVGAGLLICLTTSCTTPSTSHYDCCLVKCVEWYGNVPYISDFPDSKELWQAIVDNKETTLSFEEWKKEIHFKRDHYAKYTYCPKACKDSDIYMRMGWYCD